MKLKTRGKLETNPIQQLTHDTTIYHKPISLSSDRETVYSINIINSNGLNCSSNTGLIDLIFIGSSLTINVATIILRKIAWKHILTLQSVKQLTKRIYSYYFAETEATKCRIKFLYLKFIIYLC